MRSASIGASCAVVALLAPILLLACSASGASAQESAVGARLRLIKIPVAHQVDDDLGVSLRVLNTGATAIKGFHVTVGASGIIRNRTELHDSYEDPFVADALTLDFSDVDIPAGGRRTVPINMPVSELSVGAEDGVRAIQFSLLTEDSTFPVDTLTTQLISYSSPPDNPLNVVPLVQLNDVPAQAPDGTYPPGESGQNSMEVAIGQKGWLTAIASALDATTSPIPAAPRERNRRGRVDPEPEAPPLRLAFAPTPRVIDELRDMADGYSRTRLEDGEVAEDAPQARAAVRLLDTLRTVLGRGSVQPVLVPYSYPDLPTIVDKLSSAELGDQLLLGSTVLNDALSVPVQRGWVYPPHGRLDIASLEALQAAGVTEGVFFGELSLDPLDEENGTGCPIATLSFVCPVSVETAAGGAILGYAEDGSLQERLTELTSPRAGRVEIQRVLAETAMIHSEQPGVGERVLHFNIPSTWHPSPITANAFLKGLRGAPWLASRTPSEGIVEADARARHVVDEALPLTEAPTDDFFAGIGNAKSAVESLANFIASPDQGDRIKRLRSNILVAEGRPLWDVDIDLADSYTRQASAEAQEEMSKVTLGVPDETTFTSRAGSLDISLFNQTDYPIDVTVVLESLDMAFDPSTFERTFPPGTTRLSVEAEAQTSGTFPMQVRVETDDGYTVEIRSVQVRSTEFNIVALAITLGAVAFLILFYLAKALRRRRGPAEAHSS